MPDLFAPQDAPRVFGVAPGADFPRLVAEGLAARAQDPVGLARVELLVNSRRMERAISATFDAGPARLLPRIRLISDLGRDTVIPGLAPACAPLRRRLTLAQMVGGLIAADPSLAPASASYDLADSLAGLLDEMQGEGVGPEVLHALDVSDASGHWARSLRFVTLVQDYLEQASEGPPDPEARQALVVDRLIAQWRDAPPTHPVIIAGSTASRGTTRRLMAAVARLPQGALILPGFDFAQGAAGWAALNDALSAEDHPQFRLARLLADLAVPPDSVADWSSSDSTPVPTRNALVSMALRPAPVTDQWRAEGPNLRDLAEATAGITLLEAPSQRAEALAIALALREGAEAGRRAALVTPDRNLARRVSAALDRWDITPDDSAGRPLPLTPPGRLLRQVAALFGAPLTLEALLALLKHPLVYSGSDRGAHLLQVNALELFARRCGAPYPDAALLAEFAEGKPNRHDWINWLAPLITGLEESAPRPLRGALDRLLHHSAALAEGPATLSGDPFAAPAGGLWQERAGRLARAALETLYDAADAGGSVTPEELNDLVQAVLSRESVTDSTPSHPNIMIWGTQETRVQGADLLILGGLSEGTWPAPPPPDPWLSRQMRYDAGLLLPERRIGLQAHDFQQGLCAPEVILTRPLRDAEAEVVPARWLNRLINLLGGLTETGGPEALAAMRTRGTRLRDWATALDQGPPRPAAGRPAPQPPVQDRPRALSVTALTRLVRDPYAIYARHILGLKPLQPLRPEPDALLRGIVIHDTLDRFIRNRPDGEAPSAARARLFATLDAVLETEVPWPVERAQWRARLARVAGRFLTEESRRATEGTPELMEEQHNLVLPEVDFTVTAKPDRIDRLNDGRLVIYDYKTGRPPSEKMVRALDRQLLIEAVMAEAGAFGAASDVARVAYIGLGADDGEALRPLDAALGTDPAKVRADLIALIAGFDSRARGYGARTRVHRTDFAGDFDHLSRHGEWTDSDDFAPEEVG